MLASQEVDFVCAPSAPCDGQQQEGPRATGLGAVWHPCTHIRASLQLLFASRPRNHQAGCTQASAVSLRLVGSLHQLSAGTTNRKTLLCHQPKVALKKIASQRLLTQKLATELPVAEGNLGTAGLRRIQNLEFHKYPTAHRPQGNGKVPFPLAPLPMGPCFS